MVRIKLTDMSLDTKDNHVLELGPFKHVCLTYEHLWAEDENKELIAYFDTNIDRWVCTEQVAKQTIKKTYTDIVIEPM